jgi:hypothetical protein
MVIELMYVSKSLERLDNQQLEQLLFTCRKNNTLQDITGLLLYDGFGTFIQCLEGEEDKVDALLHTIKQDSRHTHIHILSRQPLTQRNFPDWRMGFHYFSDAPVTLPDGYSNWLTEPAAGDSEQLDNFALSLLSYFRQTHQLNSSSSGTTL